jgi:hypothetical protein
MVSDIGFSVLAAILEEFCMTASDFVELTTLLELFQQISTGGF